MNPFGPARQAVSSVEEFSRIYFSANGSMDTCILLRTALVKDQVMYVQAGVGVVADSDLEAELQESILKARALVRAAEESVRFANAGNWTADNARR